MVSIFKSYVNKKPACHREFDLLYRSGTFTAEAGFSHLIIVSFHRNQLIDDHITDQTNQSALPPVVAPVESQERADLA